MCYKALVRGAFTLTLTDFAILTLVEGIADVLPVDATAHALLVSKLVGWRAGSIAAAIHLGAALALLTYLWRSVGLIGLGLWRLRRMRIEPGTRLLAKALVAAAPWIAATSFLGSTSLANPAGLFMVGMVTVAAAIAMGLADRLCMTVKRIEHVGALGALFIGLAQLLALVTGVGRVAAALTMARLLGLERPAAYRFVLLACVPVLLSASAHDCVQYLRQGAHPSADHLMAVGVTYVAVLVAVSLAMAWIRRSSGLLPFVLYRLALGLGLIAWGLM